MVSDRIHDPADIAEIARLRKAALGGYEDGWHKLRNERDELQAELEATRRRWSDAESNLAFCDSDLQTLQDELSALRKRIEDAPVSYARPVYTMFRGDPGKEVEHTVIATAALPREWAGRKLALVVLEDK